MCLDFMPNRASDGSSVSARTLEFGITESVKGLIRKPGCSFQSPAPGDETGGLSWKNKFGYTGFFISENDEDSAVIQELIKKKYLLDGMNTEGLSCGGLWLPQTHYPSALSEEDAATAVYYYAFVDWVLGNCASVEDVKSVFNRREIHMWADSATGGEFPLHYIVYDKNGNGIVIEHVDGICHVHDNPYLVCTNGPTFDWQKTNVMNYVGLSSAAPADLEINTGFHASTQDGSATSMTVGTTGKGQGLRGIPGDYTPPSRLIRTLILKNYAEQTTDADALCTQALHILNSTDITLGTTIGDSASDADYTQITVIRDFSRNRYYFRSYNNQQLRMIDLNKAQKQSSSETIEYDITGYTDLAIDATPKGTAAAMAHAAQ